jgi:site-specific recombinase XerD
MSPSWLIGIITHHLAAYSPGVEQLVYPNTVGMPLRRNLFRARVWKPTLLRSGPDATLRFHDLRHSYAIWLVDDGVPVNMVQRVLGHERAATTLDLYTVTPQRRRRPHPLGTRFTGRRQR